MGIGGFDWTGAGGMAVAWRGARCGAWEGGTSGKAMADFAMAEVVRGADSAADAASARRATTAATLYHNRELINNDNALWAEGVRAASG